MSNTNVKPRVPAIEIEDAKFIFKTNFEGRVERYNKDGDRYFNVIIDPDMVDQLISEGWNIKTNHYREDEEPTYYLQVSLRYDKFPPRALLLDENDHIVDEYFEDTIGQLDYESIKDVRIVISPSVYMSDRTNEWAVKAYLGELYYHRNDNRFAQRYGLAEWDRSKRNQEND